ncbi:hypothetical protein GCM10010363_46810 [Streptomyces omiyaensis]|nr:hypothetical protein GCM10010363_46810 [Streptomyces omiyaensis]
MLLRSPPDGPDGRSRTALVFAAPARAVSAVRPTPNEAVFARLHAAVPAAAAAPGSAARIGVTRSKGGWAFGTAVLLPEPASHAATGAAS